MSATITLQRDEYDFQARPPRRTTTNLSVDFIETSITLAEDSHYVAEKNQFVLAEDAESHENTMLAIWEEALGEREKLEAAVQVLREKTQLKTHPKGSTKNVETPTFTWKQVVTEVNKAAETYKKSAFSRICDKSGMLEQWLTLLPNDSYSSAISGAFVIGVQAARSISGINRLVYEALASIPDVLEHAGIYVEIYQAHRSTALVKKTASLCKSILTTLRLVIEYITQGSLKRMAGAFVKGPNYQMALKDSIDDMKLQAIRVREEAGVCLQLRMDEMNKKSDRREQRAEMRSKQERFQHVLAKEQLSLQIEGVPEATAQVVLNALLPFIQSNPAYNCRTGGPPPKSDLLALEAPEQSSPPASPTITISTLLSALAYDPDFLPEDMQYCLTLGFASPPRFLDRASWVLKAPETSSFLDSSPGSRLLLIHGNDDGTQFISPLSYVVAKVADLMSVSDAVLCATYFCSRHPDNWREPRANAQGMLASLTGQILEQLENRKRSRKVKLDFSSFTADDEKDLEEDDLATTWRVFDTVVKQLPKGSVVFVFIDGLSAYENSARKTETCGVMKKLCRVVRKSKTVDIRLLVSYPGRSNYSDTWGIEFDGRRAGRLEVPEQV